MIADRLTCPRQSGSRRCYTPRTPTTPAASLRRSATSSSSSGRSAGAGVLSSPSWRRQGRSANTPAPGCACRSGSRQRVLRPRPPRQAVHPASLSDPSVARSGGATCTMSQSVRPTSTPACYCSRRSDVSSGLNTTGPHRPRRSLPPTQRDQGACRAEHVQHLPGRWRRQQPGTLTRCSMPNPSSRPNLTTRLHTPVVHSLRAASARSTRFCLICR